MFMDNFYTIDDPLYQKLARLKDAIINYSDELHASINTTFNAAATLSPKDQEILSEQVGFLGTLKDYADVLETSLHEYNYEELFDKAIKRLKAREINIGDDLDHPELLKEFIGQIYQKYGEIHNEEAIRLNCEKSTPFYNHLEEGYVLYGLRDVFFPWALGVSLDDVALNETATQAIATYNRPAIFGA